MPRLHLTDIAVRALKSTDANVTYWDDATPGFGIRVGKRRKTWTVMRGEKRERVTIGYYPALSLSKAREKAKKVLANDPDPEPTSPSFSEAQTTFLDENYRDARPRTKKEIERLLDKHFKPLHKQALYEITDADIKEQLDKLAGTPSEQLHAYRAVRAFLNWCKRPPRRYIRHSPMDGYEPPSSDRKGRRTLTDGELVKIWNAATGPFGALIKLLILWGTRNTETASLRRDWIDGDVITIPGACTKNGRDHAIPILPMARAILDEQPEFGPYLFPGRWDEKTHFASGSWGKLKRELVAASGVTNWQVRDIRRTFRSTMPRIGVPREIAEILLNHAPAALDEIYDRYDRLDEKRAALKKHEEWLAAIIAKGHTAVNS